MFMQTDKCELRVLDRNDQEAYEFTKAVNAGLTTQHLFTGSIPMRPIDIKEVWEKEFKAGSVEFGIWAKPINNPGWHPDYRIFIGTCGLYSAGKSREIYRLMEFRILIFNPDYIGKGIGVDATRLVVNYGFQRLNLHRIWLGVNEDNVGAVKCYKKVGFKEEGRREEELYCYGEWRDAINMRVLDKEWKPLSHTSAKV